jgi:hypothetical protein
VAPKAKLQSAQLVEVRNQVIWSAQVDQLAGGVVRASALDDVMDFGHGRSTAIGDPLSHQPDGCVRVRERAKVACQAQRTAIGGTMPSIRRQMTGPTATWASFTGATAVVARILGPSAMGPLALAVTAVGAMAVARLTIANAVIRKLRAEEIEIGSLKVRELEVAGQRWTGSTIPPSSSAAQQA